MPSVVHRPTATLAIASIAAFMTSLDTTVISTALPTLHRDLSGNVGQLEWTMNAYNLAFGCLLVTSAGLGDRFGRRRALCVGLVTFGLASAGAALAPTLWILIAARTAQGAAVAAVLPLTLTVISEAFPPATRGKAIGVWGGLLGAGGVLGALVGGALLQTVGWRGIFWVNVPIALCLVPFARALITETFGPRHRLDILGLTLSAVGCLSVAWGLVASTSHRWAAPDVWLPLAAGVALLGAFVAWEHSADTPMMPTNLFRIRSFSAGNTVSFCVHASLAGGVFLISQFFQVAQHATPVGAALRFVPWPLPVLLLAPVAGTLAARHGNRPFLVAGMALQTVGLAVFALVAHPTSPYIELCPPLVLSGIGLAMAFPSVSTEVVSAVPAERMGVASGVNGSLRELGGVLGIALAAIVFANAGGEYDDATRFTGAFVDAIWLTAGIAAIGLAVAILMGPSRRANNLAAVAATDAA